jgi:membrane AbrB-like protein
LALAADLKTARRAAVTLGLSAGGGFLAFSLGMPAGWVAGGLLAVAVAGIAGVNTHFPRRLQAPVFLVLGLYAGSGVSPETIEVMKTWPGSFAILGLSMAALIAGSYGWLHARCGWDRNDALLASIPGALTLIVAVGESLKADMKKVAISQSLRLLILVEAIPLLALVIGMPDRISLHAGLPAAGLRDMALLLVAGVAASVLMTLLRLPGGWLVGGLAASATLLLTGIVAARLPDFVVIGCTIAIGAIAGSRFRPGDLAVLPHIARASLVAFAIAAGISALGAGAVTLIFGVNFVQTLLAFAPGAIDALTVLAFQMNIDPAYVAAHHIARFVVLAAAVPLLARWLARHP